MTYFGNVNPDLLRFVPLTARRVLELGCGEGALAASYRLRNPDVDYVAVEAHGPAGAQAARHVSRLIQADFETLSDAEVLGGGAPFDVAVMGDVLEHMSDPDRVLARLHGMLADDGHLAISVPNVAHWTAFFHLVQGRWPAADDGLFDRTHLRFFTLQSLQDTLARTGFALVKGKPRRFLLDKARAETWIPALADMAERMGVDRQEFIGRSSALQYVVVAQKRERPLPPQMHLRTATFAPTLMDARTSLPADAMDSVPELHVSHVVKDFSLPQLTPHLAKILIVQRHVPANDTQWLQRLAGMIRAGWLVVAEWDDHPDLVAAAVGQHEPERMWTTIGAAHAVQTTTPRLRDAFVARNPEVAVFANAAFTLPPLRPAEQKPAHIFFGAANRHDVSVPVARSLAELLTDHPDASFEVVHDRAFFDALPTAAKTFHPTLPYAEYLDVMGRCDIALLPLQGSAAEQFKSDIKFVEAASRGLAVIASPTIYAEAVRDGENGLLAPALADWAPALRRLIEDADLRRRLGEAAWQDVRDHRMFADQVEARRRWYAGLWERREELQRTLVERVPELAAMLASPS